MIDMKSVSNESTDYPEPNYDFSKPERVYFYVIHCEKMEIEDYFVDKGDSETSGAASYENEYGFMEYTIKYHIDFLDEGWWVADVTGSYSHGDGWHTDDDMYFYFENIRRAKREDVEKLGGNWCHE